MSLIVSDRPRSRTGRLLPALQRLALTTGVIAGLAAVPAAQTTGIPGINGYTVAGIAPGSTSCTPVPLLGGGVFPFTITGAPGAPAALLINIFCPCMPCTVPFGPQPCPVPFSACGGTTNQSFDLFPGPAPCVFLSAPVVMSTTGTGTLVLTLPPGIRFSTQAVVGHPCAVPAFPILFTQAYEVFT